MARPPDNAMDVYVVGKQWMWKLQHLEGKREINELHVPIGQPVKLRADVYGKTVEYDGKVAGFGAGTGASRSAITAR